jgi:hypothetical protein
MMILMRSIQPVLGRQEYSADKLYWNTISGSPRFMAVRPWMKRYTYNAELEVHFDRAWLDK